MSVQIAALCTSEGWQSTNSCNSSAESSGLSKNGEQTTSSCINKGLTTSFYNGFWTWSTLTTQAGLLSSVLGESEDRMQQETVASSYQSGWISQHFRLISNRESDQEATCLCSLLMRTLPCVWAVPASWPPSQVIYVFYPVIVSCQIYKSSWE